MVNTSWPVCFAVDADARRISLVAAGRMPRLLAMARCCITSVKAKEWIMGFWIEIHCDVRTSPKCLSNVNEGPMGMARVAVRSVRVVKEILTKEALADGWVKEGDKFICPRCKVPNKQLPHGKTRAAR